MYKLVILIVLLIASIVSAIAPIRTEQVDIQYVWQIGTDVISGQQAALSATAMYDVNIQELADANKIIITTSVESGGIEFRFRITDGNENDSDQIEVYSRCSSTSGNDYWIHEATLTILQGQQEAETGYYFADTITDSNNVLWVSDTASPVNGMGKFACQTFGAKQYLFIASSLYDSDKIYIDYRRWSR